MAETDPAVQPSRRDLLKGAAAAAAMTQFGGACGHHASAQDNSLAADALRLAAFDPLRPEDFGATGRGEDQTRALAAMMAEARKRGGARIVLRAGATYAGTNPFVWGGVRELLIEGNGARLISARGPRPAGSIDANFAPFRSPTAVLPNGVDTLDFGPLQGRGVSDLGIRLRSAAKGAGALFRLDGRPLPAGAYLIYGWDRFGLDGMPPSPMCWEWVDVDGLDAGQTRLRSPLRYGYDEQAPEYVFKSSPGLRYGAARALPLGRPVGRFRELAQQDLLVVRDLALLPSTRMNEAGNEAYNGVAGFGGARRILLERINAKRLFVNCAETVVIRNCTVDEDLEIDKLLGEVTVEDCRVGQLVGAIGARNVVVGPGTRVARGTWLAPSESLIAESAEFSGDTGSPRALIGFYAQGSRSVRLEGCTFQARHADVDRYVEAPFFTAGFRYLSPGQLELTRAEYDASGIFRNLFVGAVLFDERNRPAARVTRLPWCPDGDLVSGELRIGIAPLQRLPLAPRLRLPVIAGLTIRDPRVVGPFASRVSTVFGTSPGRKADSLLAVVDGVELGAHSIRLNSGITSLDQPSHSFYTLLGRSFVPTTLRVGVVRPGPPAAGALYLGADTDDGRDLALTPSGVDLTIAQSRTFPLGALLGPAGLLSLRLNDPSRALPAAQRARWTVVLEGRYRG